MCTNIKLSKDFMLYEFLDSETATQNNIVEQWSPPIGVVENLRALCDNLLQPLRDALGESISISSGWRCIRLNIKLGGAGDSWHLSGRAADTNCASGPQAIIDKVKGLNLPFDQMIDEMDHKGHRWVHLSFDLYKNRHQMLRMREGRYEVME